MRPMKASTAVHVGLRTLEAWTRSKLRQPPRPYKVLLDLTSKCNSRCRRCAIWKTPKRGGGEEIDISDLRRFLVASGKDIVWLALSGGEVTLFDDFSELVELATRICPRLALLTFTTNGLQPSRALECAQTLRRTGRDFFVTVSLDGDEVLHDSIRGVPGNHALAVETHRLMKEDGIPVHFGITVSEDNEAFIAAHYHELRRELKAVTFVHAGGIYGQFNRTDDESIARSLRTIASNYVADGLGGLLEKAFIRLAVSFVEKGRSENVIPCAVGHTSVHIRPNGDVHTCMFLPALGNIKEQGHLSAILRSPEARRILQKIEQGECPHCWINCYAPHSILMSPVKTAIGLWRSNGKGPQAREDSMAVRVVGNSDRGKPAVQRSSVLGLRWPQRKGVRNATADVEAQASGKHASRTSTPLQREIR